MLIRCRFLKAGMPSGADYTYRTSDVVKIGDLVQINLSAKGVVTAVDVPEETVAKFADKVKTIIGKSKKEAKTFDVMAESEELCQHCEWTKGNIPHICDSTCDGKYCNETYEQYLEEFKEEK